MIKKKKKNNTSPQQAIPPLVSINSEKIKSISFMICGTKSLTLMLNNTT
jgi:hypothetical protein